MVDRRKRREGGGGGQEGQKPPPKRYRRMEEEEEEEEVPRMVDGEPVGEDVEVDPQDDGCLSDDDDDDEAGPSSSYDCQYCTSRFRNAKDLQNHAEDVHPHRNKANQRQCPHCSFQTTGYYGSYYSLYLYH